MKSSSIHPLTIDQNIAEERGSILIVDDDKLVLKALEMTLEKEGYQVLIAESGEQALEIMKNTAPALIICDQWLPGIRGIDVLQKAQKMRPDTIRILITASQDIETAINAINIGNVSQYITKPWEDKQLHKTIKTSLDRYKLIRENRVLENLIFTQHKKLKKNHKNLRHELKLGAQIHKQLLLGKVPSDVPGFEINDFSLPSKEIDGDFFEFYRPVPHILDMVLGDVMGKGIAAALVGTAVKIQMIRFAIPFPFTQNYDRKTGWMESLLKPDEILKNVHRELSKQLIDLEYFVSLFYGRFNMQYKTFSYLDCGSAKPIHFKASTQKMEFLSGDNFPLGIIETPQFRVRETLFSVGDVFVFYSDGVSEARSPENELFGVERIKNLIKNNHTLKAEALISIIHKAVIEFTKKEKLDDDLTIIVIKIGHYESPEVIKYTKTRFPCDVSQLPAVREFVSEFCSNAPGDSERLSNELQLVLNEAFCNILQHGHLNNEKDCILLSGELAQQGVIFNISDQGRPHDPSTVNEPSFCRNHDTGYGWHIMKQLTDKIQYTRKEKLQSWNNLTIYKRYYFGERMMKIIHRAEGRVLVITPETESLDARDAKEFKEFVIGLVDEKKLNGVVFDLNKLHFIDSSGLGSFLSILRHLNSQGGDLKLSQMNKPIRTMFELVKMHKIFEIFNSTEDAVVSFDS